MVPKALALRQEQTLGHCPEADITCGANGGSFRPIADVSPASNAGPPIARDAALAEAGLDLAIRRNATLGQAYTGQLAADAQDHSFKGVLAVKF